MKRRCWFCKLFSLGFPARISLSTRSIARRRGARLNGHSAMRLYLAASIVYTCGLAAQIPGKVDFGRDVQPIFKAYCIGCHGPTQQMNRLRLDRRGDAMRGGTTPVIGSGSAAASKLYLRLIGSQYGLQMPPTGALSKGQIATIKAWIDQGADWPDEFSGESPPPPPDPMATRLMEALRSGNRRRLEDTR